jgi:hypothetical protein
MRVTKVAALCLLVSGTGAGAVQADDNVPAGVSGFPPGYFLPCAKAPKAAVLVVPAPFNRFMRVLCTRAGHALAPLPGFRWSFTNGSDGWLTAINPKTPQPAPEDYFTRLATAPLSVAEVAAFRARLKTVVKNPAILTADVMRLQVDTSTADHKQEYLMVGHSVGGQVTGAWGMECYNDCNPMEASPWAFTIFAVKPG